MNRILRWRETGVAILFSALAASVARAETVTAVVPNQDCLAEQARKLDFSGVVSLVKSGAVTAYAQGSVSGPGSLPISVGTQFNLGSAGKMFTGVAVAQLLDAGKLKLDDPIGRYVHGLTVEASAVTVRQLLNHSSGLGNYFAPENLPALVKARTLRDLLPLVATEKPEFAPGARFAYSDTGYLLLGFLVESLSGQSYGAYVQKNIFGPAHMTASGFDPMPAPVRAVGMTSMPALSDGQPGMSRQMIAPGSPGIRDGRQLLLSPGRGAPPVAGPLRPAPEAALRGGSAGGAYSTAGDMQRFFAALLGGKLTTPEMLEMLVSRQIVAAEAVGGQPERDYGFGFGVGKFDGHRWFGHNGGAPGVNTEMTVFPDDGVTIVVLANRDPPVASALFRQLRADLFNPAARVCEHVP